MNLGSIAIRYSRALFEEARDKSVDKYIYDYLGALYDNMSAVPEAQRVFMNPRTKTEYKFKVLLIASGVKPNTSTLKVLIENLNAPTKDVSKSLKQGKKTDKASSPEAIAIDLYQRFLWLILKHERIYLMRFIIFVYKDLYRKHHNIYHVIFATATEIDKSLQQKVIEKIQTLTGWEVELETRIRPDLIGGCWVVVDDRLYDFSYRTRLQNIRKTLWNK